jgi:hypothetical protein
VSFNLDIALDVNVGDEYRIFLTPAITSSTTPFTYLDPIWHGSLQVFASQSVDKPAYVNQLPIEEVFISEDTTNEFVYWSQAAPITPTTTTTTAAPTTTTAAPTTTTAAPTTTTQAPTTTTTLAPTTTTTTAGGLDATFFFGKQIGGSGFDVCISGSMLTGDIDSVVINEYKLFMSSNSACTIPYGTTWDLTGTPVIYNFNGAVQRPCSSGGALSGTEYRTRVSGSLRFQYQPGSLVTPLLSFDISGSGYQDLTYAGNTLRVYGAGCVLNDNNAPC